MLPVNIDLLNTTPHHADGRLRDPHSHHARAAREGQHSARRARLRATLAEFLRRLAAKIDSPSPCLAPAKAS
ncbi:hypothetical protein ACSBLW_06435 [Thioclava sp. FR2]|uniref:hypothetical protein n=1 Tax=Thioclava sp. FR2 TaxID=3445780 RepID=UPI003EBD974D